MPVPHRRPSASASDTGPDVTLVRLSRCVRARLQSASMTMEKVMSPGVVALRSSRSGQFSDHADMSSGVVTRPSLSSLLVVTRVMDRSEK